MSTHEKLFPGPVAVGRVTGKRPHYSTYYRWTQSGILDCKGRRIRLEFVKAGNTRLTSEEAVRRFFSALADAEGSRESTPAPTSCAHRIEQAELELRDMGV